VAEQEEIVMAGKKARKRRVAGIKVPKSVMKALRRLLETPFGREVAAAALTAAAQTLLTRYPMAATVSAGSGVAGAAKAAAGHAVESVASLLHGASDRLRGSHDGEDDVDDRRDAPGPAAFAAAAKPGKKAKRKAGRVEDGLFGDLSAKQLKRLAKAMRKQETAVRN
jgi:hypothetical protein